MPVIEPPRPGKPGFSLAAAIWAFVFGFWYPQSYELGPDALIVSLSRTLFIRLDKKSGLISAIP